MMTTKNFLFLAGAVAIGFIAANVANNYINKQLLKA